MHLQGAWALMLLVGPRAAGTVEGLAPGLGTYVFQVWILGSSPEAAASLGSLAL